MTRYNVMGPGPAQVTAVVPVKVLEHAKSRLSLPGRQRRALARAFAFDTVAALTTCPQVSAVLIVSSDPAIASLARQLSVPVVPDDASDLNGAVAAGVAMASDHRPDDDVLVVPSDLPCLRAVDVAGVLTRAHGAAGAFVPDRAGTGTTMLVLRAGAPTATGYGPGSAARHFALGLRAIQGAPVRARQDVDTLDDLGRATTLGFGSNTTAVVADLIAETANGMVAAEKWREEALMRPRRLPTR